MALQKGRTKKYIYFREKKKIKLQIPWRVSNNNWIEMYLNSVQMEAEVESADILVSLWPKSFENPPKYIERSFFLVSPTFFCFDRM